MVNRKQRGGQHVAERCLEQPAAWTGRHGSYCPTASRCAMQPASPASSPRAAAGRVASCGALWNRSSEPQLPAPAALPSAPRRQLPLAGGEGCGPSTQRLPAKADAARRRAARRGLDMQIKRGYPETLGASTQFQNGWTWPSLMRCRKKNITPVGRTMALDRIGKTGTSPRQGHGGITATTGM